MATDTRQQIPPMRVGATTQIDPRVETLVLLRSIDATMRRMLALHESYMLTEKGMSAAPQPPTVTLDGPHGDPLVKAKDPRDWTGDPMTGRHFSECPAEYLDLLASRFDYFTEKETDTKKQHYNRLDAARARGWAARIRGGYQPPVASAVSSSQEPEW